MIRLDADALLCDLAETYHVFGFRDLPARTTATLACGLGLNARIMRRISGSKIPVDLMLRAMEIDSLRALVWLHTKDAASGSNRPQSLLAAMTGEDQDETKTRAFDTPEEFLAWRNSMLNGGDDDA